MTSGYPRKRSRAFHSFPLKGKARWPFTVIFVKCAHRLILKWRSEMHDRADGFNVVNGLRYMRIISDQPI